MDGDHSRRGGSASWSRVAFAGFVVVTGVMALWAAVIPARPVVVEVCAPGLPVTAYEYTGNGTGYLSDRYGIVSTFCEAASLSLGEAFTWSVFLHNSDLQSGHPIDAVSPQAPFSLVSETPAPPVQIASGGNLTVTVTVRDLALPGEFGPTVSVVAG